jgi:hypothetical protein
VVEECGELVALEAVAWVFVWVWVWEDFKDAWEGVVSGFPFSAVGVEPVVLFSAAGFAGVGSVDSLGD